MRTVLIGADFMYDNNGNLKPIEINTNVTLNSNDKVEDDADVFDFTALTTFIGSKGFTSIAYIGSIQQLDSALKTYCESSSVAYTFYDIGGNALTVPYIEDTENILIIRSAYDTTAIIDDTYCADKFNFAELVGGQSFGLEYALIDGNNTLVNTITDIIDNGANPNFILKARYPVYDREAYPKFFKVTTQEELNNVISQNVTNEYYLEPFLFNSNKLFNGTHIQVLRSFSLLYPPTLESISLGQMTMITEDEVTTSITYNSSTHEMDSSFRNRYVTSSSNFGGYPKLKDTDKVLMADGTWKAPNEIVAGDMVKTINIPNPNNVSLQNEHADFGMDIDTFNSGVTFTTSKVTFISYMNTLNRLGVITFTDGSVWDDGATVNFLAYRNNDVLWLQINELVIGDQLIALDTTAETNIFSGLKTIASITLTTDFFAGWGMGVESTDLYIVQDTTNNNSFALFEHNFACNRAISGCINCATQCSVCPLKGAPACAASPAQAICTIQC